MNEVFHTLHSQNDMVLMTWRAAPLPILRLTMMSTACCKADQVNFLEADEITGKGCKGSVRRLSKSLLTYPSQSSRPQV